MTVRAVAVLVPLMVACGGQRADSGAMSAQHPLTGTDWRVDSVTVGGTTQHAPTAAHLRIDEDGKAAGNLGCNQFSARVTVHGDRITFGDIRSTRMACDPRRMDFERTLARTLTTGTLTARSADGRLTLTDGDGDRVHLSHRAPG